MTSMTKRFPLSACARDSARSAVSSVQPLATTMTCTTRSTRFAKMDRRVRSITADWLCAGMTTLKPRSLMSRILRRHGNLVNGQSGGRTVAEAKGSISYAGMATRKSWKEMLLDDKDLPKVVPIDGKMSKRWGNGTVVIAAPREVDAVMRKVPKGKLITINEIRAKLAKKHGATIGCPITTGIFAWIAAHAAEEDAAAGKKATPYWRTLKSGGELNGKYPGGVEALKRLLEAEGHTVVARGKRWFVVEYTKSLTPAS